MRSQKLIKLYKCQDIFRKKKSRKRRMSEKYIGYREQYQNCGKNGTRFELDLSFFHSGFPQSVIVCKKYNTYCNSGVCRKERNCEYKKEK